MEEWRLYLKIQKKLHQILSSRILFSKFQVRGSKNFILLLNIKTKLVIEARSLAKTIEGKSLQSVDPYFCVIFDKQKEKSKTLKKTSNPVWNQTFSLYIKTKITRKIYLIFQSKSDIHEDYELEIQVWNSKLSGDGKFSSFFFQK